MTASSTSNKHSNSNCIPSYRSHKGMKRALSLPKSLLKILPDNTLSGVEYSKDSLLQSSTPGKRRYMRRGSRCPSMLRMAVSVPEDLANLDHEFDATTKTTSAASAGSNTDDTLESSSLYASSSAVGCYHNKAAFDLVTEALHLSSNFDDLDIDTN